jgi:hypothetical protein
LLGFDVFLIDELNPMLFQSSGQRIEAVAFVGRHFRQVLERLREGDQPACLAQLDQRP